MAAIQACAITGPLTLEPMTTSDVAAIAHLGRDPEVFEHITAIQRPFNAGAWVSEMIDNPENYIRHVVRINATRTPVGYVHLTRRANCDLELGYWLGRDYWGCGIAAAAAAAALNLFFRVSTERRIFAATAPGNLASRRVLAKLGFVESSESEPPSGMIDHRWVPEGYGP